MIFPIEIPIELVELIKFVLPELIFIAVCVILAIGFSISTVFFVQYLRKCKKLKEPYLSFTKEEWAEYKSNVCKYISEDLGKKYDFYRKGFDFRTKLCDTWCNEDDSIRYYISSHGGYFILFEENRKGKPFAYTTYMLRRASVHPDDKYLFFADGPNMQTFSLGYNAEEDQIYLSDKDMVLERVKEYYKHHSAPGIMDIDATLSEVEFADK